MLGRKLVYLTERKTMTVEQLKNLLDNYPNNHEVVLVNRCRLGHDDCLCGFNVVDGFLDKENPDDIRLEECKEDDEYERVYNIPCCAIIF